MNKPIAEDSTQSAAHGQDQAAALKQSAVGMSSPNPSVKPATISKAHVCTDACTHEGATNRETISADKSGAKSASPVAKSGNENVSMGSPEVGLDGRPAPKDAVHKYT